MTPSTTARQASLSFTVSRSLLGLMPSNHLILCRSLLLPSVFPSIRVFSGEWALRIMWPEYWGLSFSISSSNEYSGLISFRIDWFDLLAVQGTLQVILLGMGIPHHHCLGPRYPGRWRLCREDGWIGRTWGLEVPGAQCPQGVRLPGPSPPQRRLLSCATSWTLGGHRVPPTGDSLLLRGQPTLSTAPWGSRCAPVVLPVVLCTQELPRDTWAAPRGASSSPSLAAISRVASGCGPVSPGGQNGPMSQPLL